MSLPVKHLLVPLPERNVHEKCPHCGTRPLGAAEPHEAPTEGDLTPPPCPSHTPPQPAVCAEGVAQGARGASCLSLSPSLSPPPRTPPPTPFTPGSTRDARPGVPRPRGPRELPQCWCSQVSPIVDCLGVSGREYRGTSPSRNCLVLVLGCLGGSKALVVMCPAPLFFVYWYDW